MIFLSLFVCVCFLHPILSCKRFTKQKRRIPSASLTILLIIMESDVMTYLLHHSFCTTSYMLLVYIFTKYIIIYIKKKNKSYPSSHHYARPVHLNNSVCYSKRQQRRGSTSSFLVVYMVYQRTSSCATDQVGRCLRPPLLPRRRGRRRPIPRHVSMGFSFSLKDSRSANIVN